VLLPTAPGRCRCEPNRQPGQPPSRPATPHVKARHPRDHLAGSGRLSCRPDPPVDPEAHHWRSTKAHFAMQSRAVAHPRSSCSQHYARRSGSLWAGHGTMTRRSSAGGHPSRIPTAVRPGEAEALLRGVIRPGSRRPCGRRKLKRYYGPSSVPDPGAPCGRGKLKLYAGRSQTSWPWPPRHRSPP
jgi:hypothetical protein